MNRVEELQQAQSFLNSPRGQYIIGKALFYAVRELEKVEGAEKEVSDINHMKYFQKTLFAWPTLVQEVQEHGTVVSLV